MRSGRGHGRGRERLRSKSGSERFIMYIDDSSDKRRMHRRSSFCLFWKLVLPCLRLPVIHVFPLCLCSMNMVVGFTQFDF